MKVAIDSQIFSLQRYGGISRYFYNIIANSINDSKINLKVSAPYYINEYLNTQSCNFLGSSKKINCNDRFRRPLKYFNEMISLRDFKSFSPDIIHETYYSSIYPYSNKSRRIITIHDLIDFEFKDSFPIHNFNKFWKEKAIKNADHIICVSQYTKSKLQEYFALPEDKVTVIHHGISTTIPTFTQVTKKISYSYLLYVGQRWGYKNFNSFIESFSRSSFLKDNFKVICFGGGEFTSEEYIKLNSLNLESNVIQISGNDSVLNDLYRQASAFIYPSLSEGFGFPILESLSNDCPVIASNQGSIPEILGENGIYFDPKDIESIKFVIENSLNDSLFLQNNINLTKSRCSLFTVEKSVSETHQCYYKTI